MRPLALRVCDFRSFRGIHEFAFPQEPGLYFMLGDNRAEPRLGGNGAGKSTLLVDAMTWLCFERTPDGLRAGDLLSWDADQKKGGYWVELDYDEGEGGPAIVRTCRRTWRPNTWTLSHLAEFVTDEETIDLTKGDHNAFLQQLGMTAEQWLGAAVIAQDADMFLDLKKDAQAALLADVLGLDKWLERSADASRLAGDQDRVNRRIETELAEIRGRLQELGRAADAAGSRDWEADRGRRMAAVEAEYDRAMRVLRTCNADLKAAEEKCAEARNDLKAATPGDDELARHRRQLSDDLAETRADVRAEEAKQEDLDDRIASLKRTGTCPECGQSLGEKMHGEAQKLRQQAQACDRLLLTLRSREAELARSLADTNARLDEQDAAFRAAGEAAAKAEQNAAACRREIGALNKDLDRLEDRAEEIAAEKDPYGDMAARARLDADRLEQDAEDAQKRLDDGRERESLLAFWAKGFKEIRLAQVAEALVEFEVEANAAASRLGLVGWALEFRVDRETKAGSVQRGFAATVTEPGGSRAPWAAWSGGETQRLRLAAQIGQADLARSRLGLTWELEVWDEPTQGLSPEGVQDLLAALEQRAREERRQIWVVDHRAHDFGGFAGGAVVTKTAAGSSVEQW